MSPFPGSCYDAAVNPALGATLAVTLPPGPRLSAARGLRGARRRLVRPDVVTPLPQTAAQRRREHASATILALAPFIFFALAAIPRVWAPDLVPFTQTQAVRLADARRLANALADGAWWSVVTVDVPSLLLAPLVGLPDPIGTLVVVVGLLDGMAAVLVYLAARALLGPRPAVLAALLYAASPWTWALARDPALGGLTPLAAGALLAAIGCVRRSSPGRVLLLAVLGGLLPRVEPTAGIFVLPIAATLALAQPGRRAALAGTVALGALAGPALLGAVDRLQLGDNGPTGIFQLAWWLVAGVGAEHHLAGAPVPELPEPIPSLALGCAAALLLLGSTLTPALVHSSGSRAVALPLLWVLLPLLALATLGVDPAPKALVTLLPATAVLMAAPLARSGLADLVAGSVRRAGLAAGVFSVVLGTATIGHLLWQAGALAERSLPYAGWTAAADARRQTPPAPNFGSSVGDVLPLRFWQALAVVALDAAERVATRELLVVPSAGPLGDGTAQLTALLGDRLAVRPLPPGVVVLPLDHEVLYLLPPDGELPGELSWPSSRLGSVPLPGADARIELVSLRARPTEQWVARATATAIRFADGGTLIGFALRSAQPDRRPRLDLYWAFDAGSTDEPRARLVDVIARRGAGPPSVERAALPGPENRRSGELVLRRVAVEPAPNTDPTELSVALISADGVALPAELAHRSIGTEVPLVSVPAAVSGR